MIAANPERRFRHSGHYWLGEIPENWKICKLKQVCEVYSLYGANVGADKYQDIGIRFLRTSDITEMGDLTEEGVFLPHDIVSEFILSDGDLLLSRSGTIGRSFIYQKNKHGICAYAGYLIRYVLDNSVNSKFVYLYTKSEAFQNFLLTASISSTIENVNAEKYANLFLPVPSLVEQNSIVKYFDHADQIVRGGVSQKLELAELMEEYKRAVIQQAVTRGLDPDVPLKPSGVEWLGDIPEHWEVRRLKTVAELVMGQSPPSDDCSDTPVGLPFLQGCAEFGDFHPNPEQFCLVPPRVALAGSILMSVRAPVGRLNVADQDYGIGRGLCGIIPNGVTLLDDFAYYQLLVMEDALRLVSTGSTYEAVSTGDVGGQVVVTPPLTEQTAIVAHLDKLTSDIDAAIAHTRREIELLEEYRTRLIADVVTGKLDVREAAANLPDVDLDDIQPLADGGEADD